MAASGDMKVRQADTQTVLIIGGGPIGLAHAWGLKKLNPALKVVVLEKYAEYQRSHTLIMQHKPLEELMKATNSLEDPILSPLLARLKKNPYIRTNELEHEFKRLATGSGVEIKIEEVTDSTIQSRIDELKPSLVIGADGTHSVVNSSLFPPGNQVKIPFDYVLQLRFEIDGDKQATSINTIKFYQDMARHGMIANEYVGRYDSTKGKTPVTMQMMIPRDSYLLLKDATSKNPVTLGEKKEEEKKPDASVKEEKTTDVSKVSEESIISYDKIPAEIRGFIDNYLKRQWVTSREDKNSIDLKTVRISVNEAPATYAKQPWFSHRSVPVVLVGDAGLGLSYFKGLNAGIESTAKWFTYLKHAISDGLASNQHIQRSLVDYSEWFKRYAPKKIREVENYSKYVIGIPQWVMQLTHNLKQYGSMAEHLEGDDILYHYLKVFGANDSDKGDPDKHKNLYLHRSYDPNIRLGQYDYIYWKYTLNKIYKLFYSYFKPYKSTFQLKQDFKQPLVGVVNIFSGIVKIIAGLFSLDFLKLSDGMLSSIRGALEIATFPLAWTVKPLLRGVITLISGKPKIENNSGIKKLAQGGLNGLYKKKDEELKSDPNSPLVEIKDEELKSDPGKMYQLLAISADIHRKFGKSLKRGQESNINLDEEFNYYRIKSNPTPKVAEFKQYFALFKDVDKSQKNVTSVSLGSPKVG